MLATVLACKAPPPDNSLEEAAASSGPSAATSVGSSEKAEDPDADPYKYVINDRVVLTREDVVVHEYLVAMHARLVQDAELRQRYKQHFVAALVAAVNSADVSNVRYWSDETPQAITSGRFVLIDVTRLLEEQTTSQGLRGVGELQEDAMRLTGGGSAVVQLPADRYVRLVNTSFRAAAPSSEQDILNYLSSGGVGGTASEDEVLKVLENSFANEQSDHLQYVFDFADQGFDALNRVHQNDLQRQYQNTHLGSYSDSVLLLPPTRTPFSPLPATEQPRGVPFGAGADSSPVGSPTGSHASTPSNTLSVACSAVAPYVERYGVYAPRPAPDGRSRTYRPGLAGVTIGDYTPGTLHSTNGAWSREGEEHCWTEILAIEFSLNIASYQLTWIPTSSTCSNEAVRWNNAVVVHEGHHRDAYREVESEFRKTQSRRKIRACGPSPDKASAKLEEKREQARSTFALALKRALKGSNATVHQKFGEREAVDCSCEAAYPQAAVTEGTHILYGAPQERSFHQVASLAAPKPRVIILGSSP
jgi:hypothetical protein